MKTLCCCLTVLALCAGCVSYTWTSSVPEEMRTVAVSMFVNESDVTELGNIVAGQVLREFQREGTFKIARLDECAVEVQGVIKNAGSSVTAYERRTGARNREHRFSMTAEVSFIDKRRGTVVVNNRKYRAETTYLVNDDVTTGERDASRRLADDLARQIVDDAVSTDWDGAEAEAKEMNP